LAHGKIGLDSLEVLLVAHGKIGLDSLEVLLGARPGRVGPVAWPGMEG
jgi:hypothetical protein